MDKDITFGDPKGVLTVFAKKFFGEDRQVRLRPSFFPFTEPSAEVDVSCVCQGKGCRICKNTGWIEILGSGSVHPKVLAMANYDPEIFLVLPLVWAWNASPCCGTGSPTSVIFTKMTSVFSVNFAKGE